MGLNNIMKKSTQHKTRYALGKDLSHSILDGNIPTRTFDVGESVIFGNHPNAVIEEIFYYNGHPVQYGVHAFGVQYGVHAFGIKHVYGKDTEYDQFSTMCWHDLFKISSSADTHFSQPNRFHIKFYNCQLDSLLGKVLSNYAGVDFSPEYQREYVWGESDKIALLDSIFNNISIGHFVFCTNEYSSGKLFEILDGKQRLSTIIDFYEDRFKYRGYYFSELSKTDKIKFYSVGITIGELDRPTLEEKYNAFISLNTSGKVMSKNHLDVVKQKLAELEKIVE